MNIKDLFPNEQLECVILLNGGFLITRLLKSKIGEFSKFLLDQVKNSVPVIGEVDFISLPEGYIKKSSIIGWYFREIVQSPTDKVIDFMDKKLPDSNEGEEWKG